MDVMGLVSGSGAGGESPQSAIAACSDSELMAVISDAEAVMRAAMAVQVRAIAEAEERRIPTAHGARKTETWLREKLNIAAGEAKNRVLVARMATERATLQGEPIPAELPATAEAIAAGAMTVAHARVIIDGVRRMAPVCTPVELGQAESMLAGYARDYCPHDLAKLAERIRYFFDQDGAFRAEEVQHALRELHYGTAADGMTVIKARLDRETGAKFRAALQPLAAPRPTVDGEPDQRSPGQRNADALNALLDIAIASDQLPRSGGQRPHITVTIDFDDLARALQTPHSGVLPGTLTATGQPITAANVRRLACDAEILPVVLGGDGLPLDVGRAERTAPPHVRAALLLRDGTCAFPACDRPPGTPEAHHIESWIDGGATDLANLVMLCGHHHRAIHNQHWTITVEDNRPLFTPPTTVDPDRRPRPGGRSVGAEHNTLLHQVIPRPRRSEETTHVA
ncbi:HNH endonuclease [Saccharopolyspora antimicrobica]|uniref:HNH endonuclease n=3 Tax=Saccharopolyspora antimicrobica TaxID=455193 RepID=A0A1I4VQ46_9PSEU|nr:HNH endonuclease [Saccharopolyspora antimicrobica]SFN03215.1 HNH endonuclease [Saccharopolyspora antimicrobica]